MSLRFGSVCSGIEAASVAWEPLGWTAAWFSEIEPFPCAVLKHHYPDVPNLGDMTSLPERILSGEVEAPDVFCGGTPCQAFSVAGLRKSLEDARGNLSLTFVGIANAIDHVRSVRSDPPAIIFWENVPGVLSTKDNAFGCFLAALAGEDEPIVPSGSKWTNAGCVLGPQRAVAWRVLDAQYFGVAQRRRRVFVVASARDGFDPAAVLFEFGGLRRDFAPSREAGQTVAPTIAGCANGGGANGLGRDVDSVESLQPYPIANTLTARMHKGINSTVDEGQTPVVTNGSWWNGDQVTPALTQTLHNQNGRGGHGGADNIGAVIQPIGCDTYNGAITGDLAATLSTRSGVPAATGPSVMTPVAFHPTQDPISSTEVCHSIGANENATAAVAFHENQRSELTINDIAGTVKCQGGKPGQGYPAALIGMQVRRLTPVECERLQGFPDNYTAIPWRKKPVSECPDGPRYKALGNSWAVPNVRWIGKRIQHQLSLLNNH